MADHDKRRDLPPRTRLQDIAARCGASPSTVSRALAGKPGVREDLRKLILEEARRARYPTGVGLAGAKVLVAVSNVAMADYARNQFTWYVLEGLKERAASVEAEIIPMSLHDGDTSALREAIEKQEPQGVLLLTLDSPAIIDAVLEIGVPAVLVNGYDPSMSLSSVSPANRAAARLATQHLIDHGHRDILFALRPGRVTIQRRLEGWRDAMNEAGLPCGDDRVLKVTDWVPEQAEAALGHHLAHRGFDFTAVLCAGDSLAGGILKGLQARDIPVPDKVSVMGMDDLPVVEFWQPPLTAMHLPGREMGGIALDVLQDVMVRTDMMPRRVELACKLVSRQSVGRV
ncbi:LacI family DNA-binding transcriptional regulator [Lacibacterium aquatile]|uniref:LacI family DNA-binding transcriptional regulator n=1 Tax=Lacibacterium aquatile TaxID=1168082 RepID=A0ABW5DN07_9PROT